MLLETKNFLLFRHEYFYIRTEGEKIIGGFDPNLPPKTCIFFKKKTQTQQIKSWRINLLDKEFDDLILGVSEKYVYTKFSAIAFRELVKDSLSPYHDWYAQVADEDNPILLVGER